MFVLVSVYDVKAKAYSKPTPLLTEGEAIRAFTDAVNDESSIYWKHAEDFILFHVATFDEQTGDVVACEKPVPLAKAVNVRRVGTDTTILGA